MLDNELSTPEPAPSDRFGDLDVLLREYDEKAGHRDRAVQEQQPAENTDRTEGAENANEPAPAPEPELRWNLRNPLESQAFHEHQLAEEQREVMGIVAQARETIPDITACGLTDEMLASWLNYQYEADPKVRRDWDARHSQPEFARRRVNEVLGKLATDLSKRPDPDATDTRNAIVAAMTRGTGTPPPSRPPDLSALSDNEFRDYTRKNYGF